MKGKTLHGQRITGASVEARVAALGFSGTKKRLETSTALGAPVYTSSFPMLGRGPFRVDVEFGMPNVQGTRRVRFYFTHPSFAPPKAKWQKERLQ